MYTTHTEKSLTDSTQVAELFYVCRHYTYIYITRKLQQKIFYYLFINFPQCLSMSGDNERGRLVVYLHILGRGEAHYVTR